MSKGCYYIGKMVMTQFRRFKVLTVLNHRISCYTMEAVEVMNFLKDLQAFVHKTKAFLVITIGNKRWVFIDLENKRNFLSCVALSCLYFVCL